MTLEHVDVLVVGAGISGIDAAYHLRTRCPRRSFAILEARDEIGGTWSLFRYPGIRSDSDMYTFGYRWRPWPNPRAIADAPSILQYLRDAAREHGIDRMIRFGHRVRRASWSSADARWTVDVERGEQREPVRMSCGFLLMCSGYYNYEHGYAPQFPGAERFRGRIVHPQQWTDDIEYDGKRVVIVGSGATAVTLVPELARRAAHVTMVQRSPTWMVSRPSEDALARRLRRVLPLRAVHWIVRWKNVLLGRWFFGICRRRPDVARRELLKLLRAELPPDCDVATHFTPRYNPWEQRLCLVPDGDLFRAIRCGSASVATGEIETFTENGLRLRSGTELEADLIVTATGLDLKFMADLELSVDDRPVDATKSLPYKGVMLSDIPNLALVSGYTNASWTLRADLVCEYVCRLLERMRRRGERQCTPRLREADVGRRPWVDLSSGYFARAAHRFPQQGSREPWMVRQDYLTEMPKLRFGTLDDGVLEFSR